MINFYCLFGQATNNLILMKTELCLILAVLVLQTASIPYKEQIALLNSLQVGRNEDPSVWSCVGCD